MSKTTNAKPSEDHEKYGASSISTVWIIVSASALVAIVALVGSTV